MSVCERLLAAGHLTDAERLLLQRTERNRCNGSSVTPL